MSRLKQQLYRSSYFFWLLRFFVNDHIYVWLELSLEQSQNRLFIVAWILILLKHLIFLFLSRKQDFELQHQLKLVYNKALAQMSMRARLNRKEIYLDKSCEILAGSNFDVNFEHHICQHVSTLNFLSKVANNIHN